jgi:hypothetical protein
MVYIHYKKLSKLILSSLLSLSLIFVSLIYDYSRSSAASTTTYTQTTNGSYTWSIPAGVNSAQVEVWGAGGGGGGGGVADTVGGGGGGGAYSRSYFNGLTSACSGSANITVGAGGVGGTGGGTSGFGTNGGNGTGTTFTCGSNTVTANFGGGGGADGAYAGSGGALGNGNANFSGGYGANTGAPGSGSGGGSSAGTAANGVSATSATGATAPSGGGNGGSGNSGVGNAGNNPGGGGAGGGSRTTTPFTGYGGSAGADGKIVITYYVNGAGQYSPSNLAVTINPIINITDGNGGTTTLANITPLTSAARMSSATDALSVTSNDPSGYIVTIQMAGASNSLVSGGNSILANTVSTTAVPAALLIGSTNTIPTGAWGFCVPNNSGNGSYTTTFATCDSTNSSVAITAGKYAPVPLNGSPFTLFSTGSSSVGTYTTTVTFGAAVNYGQPSGTYTGTVVFTAVAT